LVKRKKESPGHFFLHSCTIGIGSRGSGLTAADGRKTQRQ
jgi:hypothetical protein